MKVSPNWLMTPLVAGGGVAAVTNFSVTVLGAGAFGTVANNPLFVPGLVGDDVAQDPAQADQYRFDGQWRPMTVRARPTAESDGRE